MSEVAVEETGKKHPEELQTVVIENISADVAKIEEETNDKKACDVKPPDCGEQLHVEIRISEEEEKSTDKAVVEEKRDEISTPQILANKPLCADYESSSDSDSDSSSDSDSDSESSTGDSDSESSSLESVDDLREICDEIEKKEKSKKKECKVDLDLSDLPPIENLRISVPEEECQEIGIITSIVDTLVVVQAYKNTAALDLDTVLFLECGKKSLGRIFDVLGPVSEPVYTVRFNNVGEITENNIKKGDKVYCAPKTEYTSFVFVSELMKMKGSDASWKNNEEAPPEFQDFSDDEEENKHKNGERSSGRDRRPDNFDGRAKKKGKIHHASPGRSANYRNPFALGHMRNQRFNHPNMRHPPPNFRYAYPHNPQPPCPPQFYNVYQGQTPPGSPIQHNYHYPYPQQYCYPPQQFAMPPVMPPPPPPPAPINPPQSNNNSTTQTPTRTFGSNIENPSKNG